MSIEQLADHLEGLLSSGLVPAALSDSLGSQRPGEESFTVSFDDAHPSVLELAAPVLAELGAPATVFVPTHHVGESDRVMGWREIKELAASPGWSVGSHGAAHERMSWRLYNETPEAQLDRLVDSTKRSRKALAHRLGSAPELFAYPFGEAPAAARMAVANAGYSAAFTVAPSLDWDGDLFGIPRIDGVTAVAGRDMGQELDTHQPGISVVVPASDRVAILREVVRRLSEQSYPEDRYEVLIIDDGSQVALDNELSELLNDRIRVIKLEGSDRTFRAGQARQAGAEAARFDVISFLDADVAVDRDFLWHLAYCHTLDPESLVLGYLSGYNLHDLGLVHHLAEIESAERLTGDLLPVIPDRSREPTLRGCLDDIHALEEPWKLAYTGNLSVSSRLLALAGGFSSEFSGWGFEDIDVGLRLHEAGGRWIFSRWALGYHLADESEVDESAPRNPFRDPSPHRARFKGVLENLNLLEKRHQGHTGINGFCAQVRADIDEICHPPEVVGVEVGAGYPFDWPFERGLHKSWPGGLPLEEILDRLAYAKKLGVRSLYLLGGDVLLRRELSRILEAAQSQGVTDITVETTGLPLVGTRALELAKGGLTGAVIELLAGHGDPMHQKDIKKGIEALQAAGVRCGAKIVIGEDDQEALSKTLKRIELLGIPLYSVVVLVPEATQWVRSTVDDEVDVEVP